MQSSTVTAITAPLSGTVVAEVLRLSRYEWFRMRRRPAFTVLCTLAALSILIPVAVAAIFVNLDFFSDGNGGSGESLKAAFGFSASPFNFVSMCIGALAFGADFGAGGYRALHIRGASRMAVPLSKVVYFLVVLAALPGCRLDTLLARLKPCHTDFCGIGILMQRLHRQPRADWQGFARDRLLVADGSGPCILGPVDYIRCRGRVWVLFPFEHSSARPFSRLQLEVGFRHRLGSALASR